MQSKLPLALMLTGLVMLFACSSDNEVANDNAKTPFILEKFDLGDIEQVEVFTGGWGDQKEGAAIEGNFRDGWTFSGTVMNVGGVGTGLYVDFLWGKERSEAILDTLLKTGGYCITYNIDNASLTMFLELTNEEGIFTGKGRWLYLSDTRGEWKTIQMPWETSHGNNSYSIETEYVKESNGIGIKFETLNNEPVPFNFKLAALGWLGGCEK